MRPDQEHEEWIAAANAEGWAGVAPEPDVRAVDPYVPRRTTVTKSRYCLACGLPTDAHNIRCSEHPDAVNPIPWPAELGPEGGWVQR